MTQKSRPLALLDPPRTLTEEQTNATYASFSGDAEIWTVTEVGTSDCLVTPSPFAKSFSDIVNRYTLREALKEVRAMNREDGAGTWEAVSEDVLLTRHNAPV